jgi:hypothetical protein
MIDGLQVALRMNEEKAMDMEDACATIIRLVDEKHALRVSIAEQDAEIQRLRAENQRITQLLQVRQQVQP